MSRACGERADEEALVRLDTPELIVSEFLQEIQGTLGDERILVPREGGEFRHALRSRADELQGCAGPGDRAAISAEKEVTQRVGCSVHSSPVLISGARG